jgi:hypothetical protein
MLFKQAAQVIPLLPAMAEAGFGVWLARGAHRLHPNVLAPALARIAWTVLAQQGGYEVRITKAAAFLHTSHL